MRKLLVPTLFLPVLLAACSGGTTDAPADMAMAMPVPDLTLPPDIAVDTSVIAKRPYMSKAPASYDPAKQYPLIVLLHGLGGSGSNINGYFALNSLVDSQGFLLAWPDGTNSGFGRFWNATDVCCDVLNSGVDDVGYLNAVMADMSKRYNVDPKRVYIVGHSNGGFMAHRLACDSAIRIAAIISLAGAQWTDVSKCRPAEPVAVLQIHGDADTTVPYEGGKTLGGQGPVVISAHETAMDWVSLDKCGGMIDTTPAAIDLVKDLPGAETTVEKWTNCRGVELWTMHGGVHVPNLTQPGFAQTLVAWLFAHPKP